MTHLPPHDEAAEQSILGAMMLSRQALDVVADRLVAEDFYAPKHAAIFAAILGLSFSEGVDPVTVAHELERRSELLKVGGAPYLHTLISTMPTVANAAYYAEIVAEAAMRRRLIETGNHIAQIGYHGAGGADAVELVELARTSVDRLAGSAMSDDGPLSMARLIDESLSELDEPLAPGRATGFVDLDGVIGGGLKPGQLVIVGARTGIGKSMLSYAFAANAASQGCPTVTFALEMSRQQVMNRFWASQARVDLSKLERRALDDDDWACIREAAYRTQDWPLFIDDNPRLTVNAIKARAREHVRKGGLVIVDYLGLVTPADARLKKNEQISQISRGLKLMARELSVPVIAAHQINRGAETVSDRRPALHHLKDSGSVEEDADIVILMHQDSDPDKSGEMELIVAKNRQGPRCSVHLAWSGSRATARSLARPPAA